MNPSLGQIVTGAFDDVIDEDFYFLDATAGQTLAIAPAGLSQLAPNIAVFDANATLIAQDTAGIGLATELSADGQYFIQLTPNGDADGVGDYTFVADLLNDAEIIPEGGETFETASILTAGFQGTFVGDLTVSDTSDLYRFELDDIEALRFDLFIDGRETIVESGKAMRIYNSRGQLLVESSSGRVSTETRDGFVPGTYFLEVASENPTGDGTYAVSYVTITDFSLQRDHTVHYMDFDSNDPYLGFNRASAHAVPAAWDYYVGSFLSRYGVYDVEASLDEGILNVPGNERVASGIGDFGDIGAGGFGGGGRGLRSNNGNTVNNARESATNSLGKFGTALVNHEFGHAVGLPHARDVQAVMSYVGTSEVLAGRRYLRVSRDGQSATWQSSVRRSRLPGLHTASRCASLCSRGSGKRRCGAIGSLSGRNDNRL